MTDQTSHNRQWKQFIRTKRSASLWHLCDKRNKTVCGWHYKKSDYISIITSKNPMPGFGVCRQCKEKKKIDGCFRYSEEIKL